VLFGPSGEVAYENRAAQAILSRRYESRSELVPERLRIAVDRAATGEASEPLELEIGSHVVLATAVPGREPGAVVLVARDVTESRRLERVRSDFVASASHELKTPVASMLALAETLQTAASDPEALHGFLDRMEDEARRLARLVQNLLDLSRLEGGDRDDEIVRLDDVVRAEAERLRPRAAAAGLRLIVDAAVTAEVRGSAGDLGLLVHNLLDNAIRYSPDGGEVRASLSVTGGAAELRVADTGIGIPSRDLDRIFERFYRVDPARSRATGGTGLGLAIVRHVAEAHRGTVRARSVLGAGSTFTVALPLSNPPGATTMA
jgi:two-component system sensor histidine kinase SenX3